jgi:hypothetical protein
MTPRIAQLIALGGCEAAMAVVLRYDVILSTGQQWGLPQAHLDHLYDKFRVRGEGFSSPLNARLLGKPGAVMCSAFPDTDAAFGSVGDFFSRDLQELDGNWYINPPFIEHILARAAHRVLDALDPSRPQTSADSKTKGQTFFFVAPAWTDSEAYAALHNSRYLIAELRLEPRRYFYEDPSGQRQNTKAASIYFALSTEPSSVRARLLDALRHVLI